MADAYVYRSHADLQALGQRIVDKAAEVVLKQDDSYTIAQQGSINDYTRYNFEDTANPHYQPPTAGEPSDNANVQEYVRQALADVPQLFTAFSVPDPDTVRESVTTPLYRAAGTLVPTLRLTRVNGEQLSADPLVAAGGRSQSVDEITRYIDIHLKHWTGDAGVKFAGYCTRLSGAAYLQQLLAINLAEVMDAHLEIRRRQLTDVWNIGENTLKTLDALDTWWLWSRKKASQTAFTVVGAIAAVVVVSVAPGTLPAAVVVGAEVLQGLGATLGTVSDPENESNTISGATVQDVIQSMCNALYTLQARVDEQQERLVGVLAELSASVGSMRNDLLIEPPGTFTDLADADLGEIQKTFVNR